MSDVTAPRAPHDWNSAASRKRVRKRYAADRRLQIFGLAAIGLAVLLLGILVASLISTGHTAFYQTKVELPVFIDPGKVKADNIKGGNFRAIARDSIYALFPDVTSRPDRRRLLKLFSTEVRFQIRSYVLDDPSSIGKTVNMTVALSDPFDQLNKRVIPAYVEALSRKERGWFQSLQKRNVIQVEGDKALVDVDVYIDPSKVDASDIEAGGFDEMLQEGLEAYFYPIQDKGIFKILGRDAPNVLRDFVVANPGVIGKTIKQFGVPLSPSYAQLAKGEVPRVVNPRFSSENQINWFESLKERDLMREPFNWALFTHSDSRFPEEAGLAGAIVGSFYTLLVCFLISFPMGISAAVYLEEFAPKNKITDLIEVNINNLAAVPSVVFGLLGLALFLNIFGLPRSAPLVGGMVLSLMTLPTIIIATRAALKAVPPSIREAALGIGASKHQVILHHVLPLAMPGILTGTIIGLAQALGETAPLLLIGMNAFITSPPGGILEPATALPTQIFSWADSPERGFVSRTSAAILVLLGFLVMMNAVAIFLRQRFERRW